MRFVTTLAVASLLSAVLVSATPIPSEYEPPKTPQISLRRRSTTLEPQVVLASIVLVFSAGRSPLCQSRGQVASDQSSSPVVVSKLRESPELTTRPLGMQRRRKSRVVVVRRSQLVARPSMFLVREDMLASPS
ncbi:hypothetical protein FA13DRAFT_6704 [Coprinellus micaceus]|uniref:Uncharacterized protein n=1 Tax=Coprinellus micaceus TaxID=71717 RepID=A0A4Y7U0D2_COPMI|nr:hypothetical protein FA13DRAFT_6704 [Coprinellus micaceus]